MDELILLDVGHGNCALVRNNDSAIVIDAPSRPVVAKTLDELGIARIEALLISHADADHLSGGIALLMDDRRPVENVYVNPDPRSTKVWLEFRQAAAIARRRGTKIHATLDTNLSGRISIGSTTLSILHPLPESCLATVDGIDHNNVALNANNMSAVIRIDHNGEHVCLLAGDSDFKSLNSMLGDGADLSAQILIFPHHGGHGRDQDNKDFTAKINANVRPDLVFFSLGRGVHGTPRPEIVSELINNPPAAIPYVACSQLSKRCSLDLPQSYDRGLDPRSDGLAKNTCCAGTLSLVLQPGATSNLIEKLRGSHGEFVSQRVRSPLCRNVIQ